MSSETDTDCPICATILIGKIFQCKEGHIVCETCLRKIQDHAGAANCLPSCPSCAGPLDDDAVCRNRALENVLENLTIRCSNSKNGCPKTMKALEAKKHEASCLYGEIRNVCRILWSSANCCIQLSPPTVETLLEHMISSHYAGTFIKSGNRLCWPFEQTWKDVVARGEPYHHTVILQGSHKTLVFVVFQISEQLLSIYSVDLLLNDSPGDDLWLCFSIKSRTLPSLYWSFPLARGIETWQFLRNAHSPKPIEIGIQSILQHCSKEGELVMVVDVKSKP